MTIDYAVEKLSEAVRVLAVGSGRIQERLADAALVLVRIRPTDDLPEGPLRRSLIGIRDDLTFEPAKEGEGSIRATLKLTSDDDAQAIANRIVSLYHAVKGAR